MNDIAKLKELLICPVCLDIFKDPRMLPCQHTFCISCIKKFPFWSGSKETLMKVRCAQCRAEISVPKGGVVSFPGNIILKSILELQSSQDIKTRSSCIRCQTVCDVKECQHCSVNFCAICEQRHILELENQLHNMKEQLGLAKGRISSKVKTFYELCDQVKECVHLEIQNRVKTILEIESNIVNQVNEIREKGREVGQELSHKVDTNIDRISQLLKEDFETASHKTAPDKVALFLEVHRESSLCLETADSTSLGFLRFSPDTLTLENELCSDVLEENPRDTDLALAFIEEPISVRVDDDVTNISHSLYYRSRQFVPRAKLGSAFLQRPAGVAVSPWSNEVYVVFTDSQRVYVFDLDRKKCLRSFGRRGERAGEFLCPYGIALSAASQEILVTDKWQHCIQVFSRTETFIRQIGSKGSGKVQFKNPEGICVDQTGRIYVCDIINNRIQVLEKDGSFVREIDGHTSSAMPSPRRSLFQELVGIAVTPDGHRIVVCDSAKDRIHVFDENGVHQLTFGQRGSLRGQFRNPECVALDKRGFLIVGDSGNSRIQIFRPDGRVVKCFGTKGSLMGQFNWISGIAVSAKNEIIVCDFKNHCIQIF